MTRPILSLILASFATIGWFQRDARAFDEIRYPGYFPSFPAPGLASGVGQGGTPGVWLGGDAGFCCPLDESRSFWSFADVAIGVTGARSRLESSNHLRHLAVGNSIAIATCRNGRFGVQHFFRGPADHPLPFFPDPHNPTGDPKGSRLWLRKAILHKGRLYIFAHQIVDPGGVFNTYLIRVGNPMESPGAWRYDYLLLGLFPAPGPGVDPRTGAAPVHFGTEAFLDVPNNYLYTYGCFASHKSTKEFFNSFVLFPLRIPLGLVEAAPPYGDLGRSSQFMTSKFDVWRDGLHDPTDFHRVEIPALNSFSVRYNATLKAWQAVFHHDLPLEEYKAGNRRFEDPLVNSVWAMTSNSPFGPWSKPRAVSKVPEMDSRFDKIPDRPHGRDCFAYFVNEQPAFEPWDGDIVFCYTIGSYAQAHDHNNGPVFNDLKLYNVYGWPAANPFFGPTESSPKP